LVGDRYIPTFGQFFKGLGLKGGRPGSKEHKACGVGLESLYTLDTKRHAAGLPLLSVLIAFDHEPSSALIALLRQLGFIRNGQSMEEILEVIQEQRERTWKHYGAEGLF
jgi:hypothetical protein